MATPAVSREVVAILDGMSERRACATISADRSSVRYGSRRPDDAPVRERLHELAHARRRFGYLRLHVF